MNAANGGARVLIGGRGHGTGIEDDDLGIARQIGASESTREQLALERSAIGLGRATAEVLHVKGRHTTIIRPHLQAFCASGQVGCTITDTREPITKFAE